jgi:hypothetical protein
MTVKPSSYFGIALQSEQPVIYLPGTGSGISGLGLGLGLGPNWQTGGGVVSHPVPSAGFVTQYRRTRLASVVTAADQDLSLFLGDPGDCSLWRGDAAARGGFYFSARFIVNAIPNTAVRFFAGLSSQTGLGVCIANNWPANSVGLWCDDADAGNLTIGTKAAGAGAPTKTALQSVQTLTAGILYEFVMIANPNQNVIVTMLINVGTGALIVTQNVAATMPVNTVFMAPQIGLSNAANVVGGDTSLDIISIYARPNLLLVPAG